MTRDSRPEGRPSEVTTPKWNRPDSTAGPVTLAGHDYRLEHRRRAAEARQAIIDAAAVLTAALARGDDGLDDAVFDAQRHLGRVVIDLCEAGGIDWRCSR